MFTQPSQANPWPASSHKCIIQNANNRLSGIRLWTPDIINLANLSSPLKLARLMEHYNTFVVKILTSFNLHIVEYSFAIIDVYNANMNCDIFLRFILLLRDILLLL